MEALPRRAIFRHITITIFGSRWIRCVTNTTLKICGLRSGTVEDMVMRVGRTGASSSPDTRVSKAVGCALALPLRPVVADTLSIRLRNQLCSIRPHRRLFEDHSRRHPGRCRADSACGILSLKLSFISPHNRWCVILRRSRRHLYDQRDGHSPPAGSGRKRLRCEPSSWSPLTSAIGTEMALGLSRSRPLGGHDPYSSSKACVEILAPRIASLIFAERLEASGRPRHRESRQRYRRRRLVRRPADSGLDSRLHRWRASADSQPAVSSSMAACTGADRRLPYWERSCLRVARLADAWNFGPGDDDAWPVERIATTMARRWVVGNLVVIDSRVSTRPTPQARFQ